MLPSLRIMTICLAALFLAPVALADERLSPAGRTELVGAETHIRTFFGFSPPKVAYADGRIAPVAADKSLRPPSPEAPRVDLPKDWQSLDFDDLAWARFQALWPLELDTVMDRWKAPANGVIAARSRFVVNDPGRVKDLRLSVRYVGGVLVYLNGREIARGHVPGGELGPEVRADKYPDSILTTTQGEFVPTLKDAAQRERLLADRVRALADVVVPADLLRHGMNVLAVEVRAAPVNEGVTKAKVRPGGSGEISGLPAYAGLYGLSLTTASVGEVDKSSGPVVWRAGLAETVALAKPDPRLKQSVLMRGDLGETPRLIIRGARNGVFSGRLIISSGGAQAVSELKVTLPPVLKAKGGAELNGVAIRVRYAHPFDPKKTHGTADRFDALLDTPPATAIVPIWVTVTLPASTAGGVYEGSVAIEAHGLPRAEVPMQVVVADWALPDTKDFTVKNVGISMTENLADFYGVPRWSPRHFELIGRSLRWMAQINDRSALVDLTSPGNLSFSNSETMVRWVKQPDGSFKYDFTIFDRYLDVVAKEFGKPLPLRLNMFMNIIVKDGQRGFQWAPSSPEGRQQLYIPSGSGRPGVAVVDPATGKMERLDSPVPGTPEFAAFWGPVFDEIHKRIKARDWLDVTGFGHTAYAELPDAVITEQMKKLFPGYKGIAQQHALVAAFGGKDVPSIVSGTVWNEGRLRARGYDKLWERTAQRPWLMCGSYARNRHYEQAMLSMHRMLPEEMIMRGQHGIFPLGEDLWKLTREGGKTWNVTGNYLVGPGCSTRAMLAPGLDGAVATERFECFREGVQACEAILHLQRGLDSGAITGDQATQVNAFLEDRGRRFETIYSYSYGWPCSAIRQSLLVSVMEGGDLYGLCAAVAKGRAKE